jgi:hypothetical protein
MPQDKAPGPNGFNGLFLKKCWHIIKHDVYNLYNDFFTGTIDLQAINNSFITLVPKVNKPTNINEFRHISLINCVVQIITKVMGKGCNQSSYSWYIKTNMGSSKLGQYKTA